MCLSGQRFAAPSEKLTLSSTVATLSCVMRKQLSRVFESFSVMPRCVNFLCHSLRLASRDILNEEWDST